MSSVKKDHKKKHNLIKSDSMFKKSTKKVRPKSGYIYTVREKEALKSYKIYEKLDMILTDNEKSIKGADDAVTENSYKTLYSKNQNTARQLKHNKVLQNINSHEWQAKDTLT